MLIINADDLGRTILASDNILRCYSHGRLTTASAMVFMDDSERAAQLALSAGIEVGFHLNLTESLTGKDIPPAVEVAHNRVRRFLIRSRYSLLLFNPFLSSAFRLLYKVQYEEFIRLYRREPSHINGHQHMHLSSNMLAQNLLPANICVRRSFSFSPSEKGSLNRFYRRLVDRHLKRRYRLTDYFYSLQQHSSPQRLHRIARLAAHAKVELMTHPEIAKEYSLLMSEDFGRVISAVHVGGFA